MVSAIYIVSYLMFGAVGVWFARRWVVYPAQRVRKYPPGLRLAALILVCWLGAFAAASLARNLVWLASDGLAYDEDMGVPFEVMYDGTGDNAVTLVFGWSFGLICLWIAGVLPRRQPAEPVHPPAAQSPIEDAH